MAKTKEEYEREAYKEFIDEFKNESDRAAVILGAAKLDFLLYQLLYKVLAPNAGSRDELLDGDAPLSTFRSRISIAYRLGLISSDLVRALNLIRKIRNDFAHELTGCKLDSGSHKDRVYELIMPFLEYEDFSYFRQLFFKDEHNASNNFRTALAIVHRRLESAIRFTKPMQNLLTELVPPSWKVKEPENKQ